jgi:hypothetical protein
MIHSYDELYNWSNEKIPEFWAAIWEFGEVKASKESPPWKKSRLVLKSLDC